MEQESTDDLGHLANLPAVYDDPHTLGHTKPSS